MRKVDIGADSTIYFGGILSDPIVPEITYKNNSLKFKFLATSFEGKNTNQYKTFLKGFDDDWSSWSTVTTKEYTNLSPGKYIFNVSAKNILGIEGSTGTYSFEILSPWYRTWWAYIFYMLVLAVGIFLVDRIQRRRLVKKERERAENERKTKELEEARQLQLSMLPRELPKLPNLQIAAFMRTATEVGGDYYDFIVQENGTLNIGFGDATGHGLQAGTMVTLMKGFFTSDAAKLEPRAFMNHCSSVIKEIKLGRILMSFSLLRFNNNRLLITSAGMPPV